MPIMFGNALLHNDRGLCLWQELWRSLFLLFIASQLHARAPPHVGDQFFFNDGQLWQINKPINHCGQKLGGVPTAASSKFTCVRLLGKTPDNMERQERIAIGCYILKTRMEYGEEVMVRYSQSIRQGCSGLIA